MRRLAPLLLLLLPLLVACGSDGKKTTAGVSGSSSSSTNEVVTTSIPSVTARPTSTSQPSATSTPPTNPSTTAPTTATAPESAEDAARGLVERWGASDRSGAAAFATPEAIDTLFANDGTGNTWMFQGCDGVAGGAVCFFSFEGGGTNMHVQNLGTIGQTGFRVDEIRFVAD